MDMILKVVNTIVTLLITLMGMYLLRKENQYKTLFKNQ
jgi:hypothetical protein